MFIKIEKTTLKDLDALQNIEIECFGGQSYSRDQLICLLENPNAISLKAFSNHKIVGFIIGLIEASDNARLGHIYTIDVATVHRRAGIGLKLLEELEHIFSENGVKAVYLEVRADNKIAIDLYQKRGYTKIQPLSNYYAKGVMGFRMKKELYY